MYCLQNISCKFVITEKLPYNIGKIGVPYYKFDVINFFSCFYMDTRLCHFVPGKTLTQCSGELVRSDGGRGAMKKTSEWILFIYSLSAKCWC